jgi:hypothetical protein
MTQMQVVAKHIVQYGCITRNTAIGMYRITRLAAIIKKMQNKGIPIVAEPVMRGRELVDYKYSYRSDYLERLQALRQANDLMERYGWNSKKKAA